ncbi:hypothetical protein [Streptomyces yaizuensis]|uniref:XRE family transcriptional regulator n=1 Tax=Streptomyces yaizuensis TaxID=2989713 RepID=A0ABQ5P604_9ACTN|nr:hypothetical protein [Streptomyces sp. YSPA8]GLF98023.1 hypothetical protein SYYSPA8_27020 [Streptomyces sp. YSPA8]
MDTPTPGIDLTRRTEPLSLSDISRAFGLSRSAAQKWHKPPAQAATGNRPPAHRPALHAVAEAIGVPLGPDVLDSTRPRYPADVVIALGKALGYLDLRGRLIQENQDKGRGRWLPTDPTIDPATRHNRYYTNHVAAALGVTNEAVEMGLTREQPGYPRPDGTDEMGRSFWWSLPAKPAAEEARPDPRALLAGIRAWLAGRDDVARAWAVPGTTAVGIELTDGTAHTLTLGPGT